MMEHSPVFFSVVCFFLGMAIGALLSVVHAEYLRIREWKRYSRRPMATRKQYSERDYTRHQRRRWHDIK